MCGLDSRGPCQGTEGAQTAGSALAKADGAACSETILMCENMRSKKEKGKKCNRESIIFTLLSKGLEVSRISFHFHI